MENAGSNRARRPDCSGLILPSGTRVKKMTMTIDERIKSAGLLHMSGDDYMSPELIDDAIEGTLEVHSSIDLTALAKQIKGDQCASGESR